MRKYLLTLIALAAVLLITACGDKKEETKKDADGNELEKVTVMLDWYPNALHSFLYVAEEQGYFEDEGLDVEFQFPANTTDPLNLAAANKIDIGIYYQPDVILARANQDIKVKSFASIVRAPLNHVVFRADEAFESPKELEGEKVGYPGTEISESIVKTIVENDGGDFNKVDLIDVGFDLGGALTGENAEAVAGMFVNHEVPLLTHQGHKVDYFNPAEYGVPNYHEVIAVTSDDTWENEEEKIRKFWNAATKGYEFVVDNPEESLELLLDNQNEENFPLELEVETDSLKILLPKLESEDGFGSQDKASWEETAEWLKKEDLIDEIPNLDEIFVDITK